MVKKKGFTLIELIVVIAIIGVLALILVPAMVGYIRSAKIRTADEAATNVKNGVNACLADVLLYSKLAGSGWENFDGRQYQANKDGSGWSSNSDLVFTKGDGNYNNLEDALHDFVIEFFPDFELTEGSAYIDKGVCTAVVLTVDGNYWGAFPTGAITTRDYKTNGNMDVPSLASAKKCVSLYDKNIPEH